MNTQPQRLLHTKAETAYILSVCLRTIDNLIISKQLRPTRIGRRVLISTEELKKFCKTTHPELN